MLLIHDAVDFTTIYYFQSSLSEGQNIENGVSQGANVDGPGSPSDPNSHQNEDNSSMPKGRQSRK